MADLASSGVTFNRIWYEGDRNRRTTQKCVDVTLVLGGQGTTTNKITAAVLGLSQIYEAGLAQADGEIVVVAGPSYDRSTLLLFNLNQATDANRSNPFDLTDTIRVVVKGKEA